MPKPNPPTASQIRAARLTANLSQPELAAHMAGITEEDALRFTTCLRSLRAWEQGLRQPDYENTRKLQQLLNLQETDR